MTKTFNQHPYYDDFDEEKGFHRILFKPSVAVQARELTQLQTIINNQIEKFGNHIFKNGSVVIPGNTSSDLNVPYVKLETTAVDVTTMEGLVITNGSGITALVRKGVNAVGADPATLYLGYISGNPTTGAREFADGEALQDEGAAISVTALSSNATGYGSLANITKGVFFVNGVFANVSKQTAVIGKYTNTPSCHVLLRVVESVVNADTDSTLLDPAQGSYNYSAPGADRYKLILELTTLPLGSAITEDYIEIMRYNAGVLEMHAKYPKYNELEKSLARRTYDESGDYVVDGLKTTVSEHLLSNNNGGRYTLADGGDTTKFIAKVKRGKAYIQGFENETIIDTNIVLDKGRTAAHIKTQSNVALIPNFGQYFYVTDLKGMPLFKNRETITLWDSVATNGGAVQIGTATAIAIDYYESNTTDQNALFKFYISDVTFTSGKNMSNIGGVRFASGSATVLHKYTVPISGTDFTLGEVVNGVNSRKGTVGKWTRYNSTLFLYRHDKTVDLPYITDQVTGASSTATGIVNNIEDAGNLPGNAAIVQLPHSSVYKVRDGSNLPNITYKSFVELTVTTDGTGAGSASVTGMTIDPKEQGNMLITSASGVQPLGIATVSPDGLSLSIAGGPASTVLKVIVSVTKSNVTNKTKNLVSGFAQGGISPSTSITLTHADIYRLVSVVSTVDGDVTSRFVLDNGQRDYAYLRGKLNLVGAMPSGTLTATYDYFSHSGASGDFFSADSYEASGLSPYYDFIPTYRSPIDGTEYDLRNCLDFRPRQGSDGTFSSGLTIDMIQMESRLTTSIRYYVPRYDIVHITKAGKIEAISGVPNEFPRAPTPPKDSMLLSTIFVPAYTMRIRDVKVTNAKNEGFTMAEVSAINDRLTKLEDYTLLTQAENNIVNSEIFDASTGLNRFKSGYLVDNFDNPDVIADIYHSDFKAVYYKGTIRPQFEESIVTLPAPTITSGATINSKMVTVPFTEVVFAKQPYSTRITNVNPFAVFNWTGTMKIQPSVDNWTETEYLPNIFKSETEINYITKVNYTTEVVYDYVYTQSTEYVNVTIPWQQWNPTSTPQFVAGASPVAGSLNGFAHPTQVWYEMAADRSPG